MGPEVTLKPPRCLPLTDRPHVLLAIRAFPRLGLYGLSPDEIRVAAQRIVKHAERLGIDLPDSVKEAAK